MNLTEYQQLAKRTLNHLGSIEDDIFHMRIGVITKLGELLDAVKKHHAYGQPIDLINVAEEVGDIAFYLCNWATLRGLQVPGMTDVNDYMQTREHHGIKDCINQVINLMSGVVMWRPGYDIEYETACIMTGLAALANVTSYFNLDFEDSLERNIAKLKVRYPDKFSEHKAVNRNLDRERRALEWKE